MQRFDDYVTRLEPSAHSSRLKTLKLQSKDAETCTWIFESVEYQQWLSAERSRLLRISGDSGCGKSVLTSNVIQNLLEGSGASDKSVVAYFYCVNTGNTDGTEKASRLLQDIVYQLYAHTRVHKDALAEANRLFMKNEGKDGGKAPSERGTRKTIDLLGHPKDTLVDLVKILHHEQVFLIVDALDECVDRADEELLELFDFWLAAKDVKIKIFASSRPEHDIRKELDQYPTIDLAQHNNSDIARKIDTNLAQLTNLTTVERKRIKQRMIEKAEGQFTYVDLAIKILHQP